MSSPTPALDPVELGAYFSLIEATSLLRHSVELQLKEAGDLSYVQFQLLARLGDAPGGSHNMTELADGVVYSRSGLTYQVGQMEKADWVERSPSPEDDRGVTVTITDAGRARLAQALPGHVEVLRELLFAVLTDDDVSTLAGLLEPVLDHMRAGPPRSATSRRRGPAASS